MAKSQKKRTWEGCSEYIRLRDAIRYNTTLPEEDRDYTVGPCCTCGIVKKWRYMDPGHFIPKGSGGHSGVYFDERNIHLQCKRCNAFFQGRPLEYGDFMLKKYGKKVIDELRFLNKNNSYKGKLIGLELYYKTEYKRMCAEHGMKP